MVIVPTPALPIVTSSALVGTALFDQLLASPQLRVPARPVQETAEGVTRSSSCSSHSGALVRRCFLADSALKRFRASTHCLIHRRQVRRRGIVGDPLGVPDSASDAITHLPTPTRGSYRLFYAAGA